MAKKKLVTLSLMMFFIIGGATSAMATVTGITSDGCPGTTCLPSFVTPIVASKTMIVTIKGQFVDLSTGVEISGSGVSVSYGQRQGGSNSYIEVKFAADDSAPLGERTVKMHYAVETNGPDTFKVRVVHGGRVDRIEQKVSGPTPGTTRLVEANAIPVNQRVTLVFTGTRLGNAVIAPILAVKNPQTLPGCSDTRCEFELELTQTGNISINLYDADVGPQIADSLAVSGTLHKFFYTGAKNVSVTGASNSPANGSFIPRPIVSGGTVANAVALDVAPGDLTNLFRGTGNSFTDNQGVKYLQVDDSWCSQPGKAVQAPSPLSPPNFQDITIPDLIWKVLNVSNATIPAAFDSQLLSNGVVLQTGNTPAGLAPNATREFTFRRTNSNVRVFRFAAPNPSGCFIKPSAGAGLFFVDPPFTVMVVTGNPIPGENVSNNSRNY